MKRIAVDPITYVYFALLLMFIPIRWLIAWVIAVLFHEFCHLIAVKLCGGNVLGVSIGVGGINMVCDALSRRCRFISVLCGPLGGLLLLLLSRYIPRIAICSWILSVYNLLPLLPLDGGRALRLLIDRDSVYFKAERIILVFLTVFVFVLTIKNRLGILPLMVVIVLWIRNRKRPCNVPAFKVQ